MSPNSIRGRASFSFKGEVYEPEAVIDLDACLGEQDAAPDFHRLLGRAAGIDPDSYLYEVFESHPITFSDAAGAAAPHCVDGGFDWKHFEQDARDQRDWQIARRVAGSVIGTCDWEADPMLKAALLAVYRAGKSGMA